MICNVCNVEKSEVEFNFRNKADNIRRKQCKSCYRQYQNQWYVNNTKRKHEVRTRHEETSAANLAWCREQLQSGCVDCGITDIRVLEFDHVKDIKRDGVMRLARYGASRKTLEEEIAKCEIRCRNCHMIVTYERGDWTYATMPL